MRLPQAGWRPVLVISNEAFNRRSGLVTVLPLTTARRDLRPWEVFVQAGSCGLPADSIALPHQIRTIAEKVLLHCGFSDLSRLDLEE